MARFFLSFFFLSLFRDEAAETDRNNEDRKKGSESITTLATQNESGNLRAEDIGWLVPRNRCSCHDDLGKALPICDLIYTCCIELTNPSFFGETATRVKGANIVKVIRA